MWHAYRVELYPHYDQFTGITDEYGNPLTFPAVFRKRRRDDEPKGIVKVVLEETSASAKPTAFPLTRLEHS